ncbi:NAD(P)/FAD-dependent oxidoreductase [Tessaracoccus sp. OS52]|uniref:NAD(P)-binding domain-containing protein n=1 Tax=Tessaracoccus sp. OS52 TaxID=2886691 RepID=UPI001D0F9C50|nr:NAD(P)/FAD-dependent oxidoreductase [Tessaracoccus sp. OS52]
MGQALSSIVIGAGQAGLSAAHHLKRLGLEPWREFVVLDRNEAPGGAWQHRWDTLTMRDVHGVAALPGEEEPSSSPAERANVAVPEYFAAYESGHGLPVERPVRVDRVTSEGALLRVRAGERSWLTHTLVNATGTWNRPFLPYYPGVETFTGRHLHTHDYGHPSDFAGQHVVVVGGGASAVQLLAEVSEYATTTWVTRREPIWRTEDFTPEAGRAAVALVEERVRQGLPAQSVVSVTGLMLREQELPAFRRGVYDRHPMFERIDGGDVVWPDGTRVHADAIIWATGFRPDVAHLAPLGLTSEFGGIQLEGTEAVVDPRIQLVGYGPSSSTIGANRAGRTAAVNVLRQLGR